MPEEQARLLNAIPGFLADEALVDLMESTRGAPRVPRFAHLH